MTVMWGAGNFSSVRQTSNVLELLNKYFKWDCARWGHGKVRAAG